MHVHTSNTPTHSLLFSLTKDYQHRPKYKALLNHVFIKRYSRDHVDVTAWYQEVQQTIADAQALAAATPTSPGIFG